MNYAIWIPTAFSVILCWGYLFLPGARSAFLSFLPITFVFVAIFQQTLVRRITELENGSQTNSDI